MKFASFELRRFCQGGDRDLPQRPENKAYLHSILGNFNNQMADLQDSPEAVSAKLEALEVMKILGRMGDRNKNLYDSLIRLSGNGRS